MTGERSTFGFKQNTKRFSISGNINYSNEFRKNPPNVQQQDFSPVVIYTLSTTMPTGRVARQCL